MLTACQGTPPSSAAPEEACNGADEQRAPGFYADLEALVPTKLGGSAPTGLESGRYCSRRTLGSLLDAGVPELRFAGASQSAGFRRGVSVAVFRAPGLTLDALADSFATGADSARRVSEVHAEKLSVAGRPAIRIDAVERGQPQTVVLWPAAPRDTFNAVIAVGSDEAAIAAGIDAFGDG
ncbi:MAG: hypothetical protein ACR2JZ_02185 [Candidatus Limnocylindrales bacterium]